MRVWTLRALLWVFSLPWLTPQTALGEPALSSAQLRAPHTLGLAAHQAGSSASHVTVKSSVC